MPRGGARNNKPTALKLVTGNPGKRPLNGSEPMPELVQQKIDPPRWMGVEARRCWRDVVPVLQDMKILTEADLNTVALYCQAWSRYRAATAALESDDLNPEAFKMWSVRLEKAEASVRLLSHDLGLNPAARARLSVGKTEKPVDEMEELLSGRNRAG